MCSDHGILPQWPWKDARSSRFRRRSSSCPAVVTRTRVEYCRKPGPGLAELHPELQAQEVQELPEAAVVEVDAAGEVAPLA